MPSDVRTTLSVVLKCLETSDTTTGFGSHRSMLKHDGAYTISMLDGTDANESDLVYSLFTSVSTGVPHDHDLVSLVSGLTGSTLTYAEVTAIVLVNESQTPGESVTVGAGSNPVSSIWGAAGDAVVVGPGGVLVLTSPVDGYAVTASTADILRVSTTSSGVSYRLIILGRSA